MKKKILTLFLAFAIMMTFMPSMAFAADRITRVDIDVTCESPVNISAKWTGYNESTPYSPETISNITYKFYSDESTVEYVNENGAWKDAVGGEDHANPLDFEGIDHVLIEGQFSKNDVEFMPYDPKPIKVNATLNSSVVSAEGGQEAQTSVEGNVDADNSFQVAYASDTTLKFYMYYQFPKAIGDVCVGFTAPKTVNDPLVINAVDCYDYYMTSTVFDVNGIEWTNPQFKEGDYTIRFIFEARGSNYFAANGNNTDYLGTINGSAPSEFGKSWLADSIEGLASGALEGNKAKYLIVESTFTVGNENSGIKLSGIAKVIAAVTAVAAVAGVVGTVVKNVQKAAVAQQMAFQAKMQQQMVQKQVASIKTVLKGAGVVFSLASFGSSLGKLLQLNQFGFNQFGFR